MKNRKDRFVVNDKANIIKESLRIVDKLGNLEEDYFVEYDEIYDLIIKAKKLKKSRLWKL